MGTKANPGSYDCYANALPDEPMFVLLARDPLFAEIVNEWARRRRLAIECGERPESDKGQVLEAIKCAAWGAEWRRINNGAWRNPKPAQRVCSKCRKSVAMNDFCIEHSDCPLAPF